MSPRSCPAASSSASPSPGRSSPGLRSLLADEPTGNLDTARSREIMELLTGLNRASGITIIMVTHEPDMAGYAARTIRFLDGRVESDGPAQGGRRNDPGDGAPRHPGDLPQRARSFLTVLGVVIGVGAVIAMVTIGNGTTAQVQKELSSLGTNLLFLRPGQGFGPGQAEARKFTLADVDAIGRQIAGLQAVAPTDTTAVRAVYGHQNWSTSLVGTTGDFLVARDWPLADGRQFLEGDMRSGKPVCIIGKTVRTELFGATDPIGQRMRVGTMSCSVIGVLAEKGQSSFGQDQDDTVLAPIRLVQRRFLGNTDVQSIYLSAADGVDTAAVRRDVTYLMRERRRIAASADDDFRVNDMAEMVATLTSTTRVLTGLLAAVAAVSLLVGGIGIMNIMLVSVTERTREIGIRLAIGAEESQVLMQFLVEAIVLSLFGGLVGIGLGLGLSAAASAAMHIPFVLSLGIVGARLLLRCRHRRRLRLLPGAAGRASRPDRGAASRMSAGHRSPGWSQHCRWPGRA